MTVLDSRVTYVRPRLLEVPGSRMEVICSDIDSTIADTRQRRAVCPTVDPARTWTEYAMLCGQDEPITGTIRTLKMFSAAGYGVHLVTNRPEPTRKLTTAWLARHGVPYDALVMRPAECSEISGVHLKLGYLATLRIRGFEPVLFLEDWPADAAEIEADGVPVMCINPRYKETPA